MSKSSSRDLLQMEAFNRRHQSGNPHGPHRAPPATMASTNQGQSNNVSSYGQNMNGNHLPNCNSSHQMRKSAGASVDIATIDAISLQIKGRMTLFSLYFSLKVVYNFPKGSQGQLKLISHKCLKISCIFMGIIFENTLHSRSVKTRRRMTRKYTAIYAYTALFIFWSSWICRSHSFIQQFKNSSSLAFEEDK